jgi:Fur family ferric uptake transcriptional regulator
MNQAVGQRQTRQREAILHVLTEADGPLSVPEIHARALKLKGKIGIATVYRTLKLLQAAGKIQPVNLPTGETCYQCEPHAHHDHFQCRKCRHVFDLDVCPLRLKSGTRLKGGFVIEDHQMLLYGLCPACAK